MSDDRSTNELVEMTTSLPMLLTTEEVAQQLRVNPSTIRRWRLDGLGPRYVKVGTVYRYPRSALDDWLAARLREAEAS